MSKNPNHLQIYKDYALELFEKELDELGIDIVFRIFSYILLKSKPNLIDSYFVERERIVK